MKQLRVALCAQHFRNPSFGVSEVSRNLVHALSETRGANRLEVYQPWRHPIVERDGPEVFGISSRLANRRWSRVFWENSILPASLMRHGAQVAHCLTYVAPWVSPVPIVLSVHDTLSTTHPEFCKPTNRAYHRLLSRRSLSRAARVVVPSNHVKDELMRTHHVSPERISVVPFGVDESLRGQLPQDEAEAICRKHGVVGRFALWVGNLEPKKGIPTLLDAIRIARSNGWKLNLVMAGGTGWGSVSVGELERRGVHWLGYVPRSDLKALYQQASVFVFPSVAEGFGLPILEAMACGTPVVCSAVPAAAELAPDAAMVVPSGDPAQFAAELLRLENTPELCLELAARGRRIADSLTWKDYGRRLWSIYDEVAAVSSAAVAGTVGKIDSARRISA
jgi:glycosyltransferase involved in cell wall biosynthesis